jgi:hypothetical protein
MLTHVGRILYWLGSILAVAILLSDLLLVAWEDEPRSPYSGYFLIGYGRTRKSQMARLLVLIRVRLGPVALSSGSLVSHTQRPP